MVLFFAILKFVSPKKKNTICQRRKNHENESLPSVVEPVPCDQFVGTSPAVPVPCNRNKSLCYSELLFLLVLVLLLVGDCQIFTLCMCLYQ